MGMDFKQQIKRALWAILAQLLSHGLSLVRRERIRLRAEEWRHLRFSFGQLGEDRVIVHLLNERLKRPGFYVDIGAFDPVLYSNTLLLHRQGWQGINVDANPAAIERFRKARPLDRSLCVAVSDRVETLNYTTYESGASNRLVETNATSQNSLIGESAVEQTTMTTTTLSLILEQNGVKPGGVNFLNVDCEGFDLRVLQGLDWSRWKPQLIAIETHTQEEFQVVEQFLAIHGYTCAARISMTSLFLLN